MILLFLEEIIHTKQLLLRHQSLAQRKGYLGF